MLLQGRVSATRCGQREQFEPPKTCTMGLELTIALV